MSRYGSAAAELTMADDDSSWVDSGGCVLRGFIGGWLACVTLVVQVQATMTHHIPDFQPAQGNLSSLAVVVLCCVMVHRVKLGECKAVMYRLASVRGKHRASTQFFRSEAAILAHPHDSCTLLSWEKKNRSELQWWVIGMH